MAAKLRVADTVAPDCIGESRELEYTQDEFWKRPRVGTAWCLFTILANNKQIGQERGHRGCGTQHAS